MNIFQFFEVSGAAFWLDWDKQVTYFKQDDGVLVIPWDASYRRWISKTWYQ
jgi:hypothetical protein